MDEDTIAYENELSLASRLQEYRVRDILSAEAKVGELAARVARKLNKLIEQGHDTTAFLMALSLAGLKDFLDLIFGTIPIISIFLSLTLAYFMWGKGWFLQWRIKLMWWVVGFFLDDIPGFDALPLTTLTVLYGWHIVRKRARKAEEDKAGLDEATQGELEALDEELEEVGEDSEID